MAAWPYGEHQSWPLPRTGRHRADDHGRHRSQTLARNWRPHRALGVLAVAVTSVAVLVGAVAGTGASVDGRSPFTAAAPRVAVPSFADDAPSVPPLVVQLARPAAPLVLDRPRRVVAVVPDPAPAPDLEVVPTTARVAAPTTTTGTPTSTPTTSSTATPTSSATPTGTEGAPDRTSTPTAEPTTTPAPSCSPTPDETTGATS